MGLAINTVLRPLLIIITLPISLLSLGLFALVINACTFWLAGGLLDGVVVDSFTTAFLSALLYSVLSTVVNFVVGPSTT